MSPNWERFEEVKNTFDILCIHTVKEEKVLTGIIITESLQSKKYFILYQSDQK